MIEAAITIITFFFFLILAWMEPIFVLGEKVPLSEFFDILIGR